MNPGDQTVAGRLTIGSAPPWGRVVLVAFGFIEPVNSATNPGGFTDLWTFNKLGQNCRDRPGLVLRKTRGEGHDGIAESAQPSGRAFQPRFRPTRKRRSEGGLKAEGRPCMDGRPPSFERSARLALRTNTFPPNIAGATGRKDFWLVLLTPTGHRTEVLPIRPL